MHPVVKIELTIFAIYMFLHCIIKNIDVIASLFR